MTPQEFRNIWAIIDEPLSPISKSRLERFKLNQSTFDFLNLSGLPVYCEPNLYFANDTNDIVYGVNKLTEQYNFELNKEKYDKYIVIGACRDGDAIAIDTEDNEKIVELDHEDLFSSKYFNSSINILADFLILYRDFEKEVLIDKDSEDNFQCFNFSNNQFDNLKEKMIKLDKKAVIEEGFWKEELEIMLSIRQEKYGITF
jgi:SUKH-4 immunity protein